MYRGDDKKYELEVTDKQTGEPVAINGCTFKFTWKINKSDANYVLQKTVGSGIELTDPDNGVAEITIDAADTSSLTKKTEYYFDIEITKTDTKVETLMEGKFKILMDVS